MSGRADASGTAAAGPGALSATTPPTEAGHVETPPGGGFLVAPLAPEAIFTPERLTEEHRAIGEAVRDFCAKRVGERAEAVEGQDYATHRELLAELGADGYVGVEVPEAHGGAGLDTVTSVMVSESLAGAGSFAVTYLAHAGIGTLPIVFFGTEEQRAAHLPGLAAGTTVGAYALTEPGSGSDARAMRTTATHLPEGGWRLDGTKQFITNAGFADLFTLYARLEDGGIAAFLVPRDRPGVSIGPEEHKMGIRGSSTCQVILEGVELPQDALLGVSGEGHKIAFNILNVGRFKLAAGALGSIKLAIAGGLHYARERVAFGKPIVEFPLVAAKLAGMAVHGYAVESATYRIAGMLDARLEAAGEEADSETFRAALEEYAVECSLAKVLGSESLDWVVDELVQLHGGYGYTTDFPAERAYRDARINRIWEGTNEINRLLVPSTLIKRAMQGRIDLLGPASRVQSELLGGESEGPGDGPLAGEAALVAGMRSVALLLSGAAFERFGTGLEEQQEVLADLADLSIDLFAAESALLRAQAAAAAGGDAAAMHADLAQAVVLERAAAAEGRAKALAGSLGEGDEARMLQSGVRRLLRGQPVDRVALGRRVAGHVVAAGGYPA